MQTQPVQGVQPGTGKEGSQKHERAPPEEASLTSFSS